MPGQRRAREAFSCVVLVVSTFTGACDACTSEIPIRVAPETLPSGRRPRWASSHVCRRARGRIPALCSLCPLHVYWHGACEACTSEMPIRVSPELWPSGRRSMWASSHVCSKDKRDPSPRSASCARVYCCHVCGSACGTSASKCATSPGRSGRAVHRKFMINSRACVRPRLAAFLLKCYRDMSCLQFLWPRRASFTDMR